MAKSFQKLLDAMEPERRERIERRTRKLLGDLELHELRQSREFTQRELAESLQISQASVSKMENQSDMRVSTLRRIVEALGGELEIIASFPDGAVRLHPFDGDEGENL